MTPSSLTCSLEACSYDNNNRRRIDHDDGSGPFPESLYDIIVSYLPIRDAIRTSLVSRAWRFRWRSIPYLVFGDEASWSNSNSEERLQEVGENDEHSKASSSDSNSEESLQEVGENNEHFISRVLLLHEGRIKRFEVSSFLQDDGVMDVWIPALTVSGIEQFIFKANDPDYLVHSDLFNFHGLTTLKLFNCTVPVPSETRFKGFPSLTELVLQDVFIHRTVDITALGTLISSCPMVKRLSLGNIVGMDADIPGFEVSAPSLKWLALDMIDTFGYFHIDAPILSNVEFSVIIAIDNISYEDYPDAFNLINMLPSFSSVEKLVVESIGRFPIDMSSKLPFELPYLKHLELYVFFECLGESITTICLLRSAPMLRSLHVKNDGDSGPYGFTNSFLKEHDIEVYKLHYPQEGCKLNNLQLLEFEGMRWSQEEMILIKFVLQNAPFLSKIYINTEWDVGCVVHLVKDLLTVKNDTAHGTLCINDMGISF